MPVAGDFRTQRTMTAQEAQFIASHYALVALEKGQGLASQPEGKKHTEEGFAAATKTLKQLNPQIKILYYWNSTFHYPLYRASASFDRSWCIRTAPGKGGDCRIDPRGRIRFDRSNPALREWWVTSAAETVRSAGADGVFIDAVGPRDREPLLQMISALSGRLGPERNLIIFNDVPGEDLIGEGNAIVKATHGFMIENFDIRDNARPEELKQSLMAMMEAGRREKIVILKAWPGFSFLDKKAMAQPYEQRVAMARKNITFPLACFLVAAQPYSYFQYSWGWAEPDGGNLIYRSDGSLDPTWYPELLKRLGPPAGPAKVDGYRFTRQFQGASVEVDLQKHTSRIDWR